MLQSALLYALLLLVAAGVSLTACGILWTRRTVSGAIPLFAFMGALFLWSLFYAIFWLSTTPQSQIFWLNATYFGVVFASPTFMVFTLYFTHREAWVNRYTLVWLSVEPILTLLLLWTDPMHGLFFAGKRVASSSAFLEGGIWFWFNIAYTYGMILAVSIMLVRYYRRVQAPYRQQAHMMLFGILFPWVGSVISLSKLDPLPGLDLTPVIFTVTGLIVTYALFYNRLFDLMPIARDRVMETMHEPVFVLDVQDRIVDVNPSAQRLLVDMRKQEGNDFIGAVIHTFFPAEADWAVEDTAHREIQIQIDSQNLYYEYRLSQLSDARGHQQGKVLVLNNVTRRKQVQQRELEIKLEKERGRLLAEFIKNASHEFRTPLATISSTAYLMARSDDRTKRIEKADSIQGDVSRITKLVDMMLTTTALDTTPPEAVLVNVDDVLRQVRKSFPPSPKHASITYDVRASLSAIKGFDGYLETAFAQIIENAVRFTPVDGQIIVRAYQTGDCVIVEVQDTGVGIGEADLSRIFNTFWRKDAAHSTPGLGLGLSIAQKVIQSYGGDIDVESKLGKGSLFRVKLPAVL